MAATEATIGKFEGMTPEMVRGSFFTLCGGGVMLLSTLIPVLPYGFKFLMWAGVIAGLIIFVSAALDGSRRTLTRIVVNTADVVTGSILPLTILCMAGDAWAGVLGGIISGFLGVVLIFSVGYLIYKDDPRAWLVFWLTVALTVFSMILVATVIPPGRLTTTDAGIRYTTDFTFLAPGGHRRPVETPVFEGTKPMTTGGPAWNGIIAYKIGNPTVLTSTDWAAYRSLQSDPYVPSVAFTDVHETSAAIAQEFHERYPLISAKIVVNATATGTASTP